MTSTKPQSWWTALSSWRAPLAASSMRSSSGDPAIRQEAKASKKRGGPSSKPMRARPVLHLPKTLKTGAFKAVGIGTTTMKIDNGRACNCDQGAATTRGYTRRQTLDMLAAGGLWAAFTALGGYPNPAHAAEDD